MAGGKVRKAALKGGSNGGTPPRKLRCESGPTVRFRAVALSDTFVSDRAQLAVPTENPNHHPETESKTEDDHKVFLAVHLHVWVRHRNGLARGRTHCVLPLAHFPGQ